MPDKTLTFKHDKDGIILLLVINMSDIVKLKLFIGKPPYLKEVKFFISKLLFK